MEDKNKLFVFDKKEVLLIFVFMIVIASTAFTIGVKMGMKWQLEDQGITKADHEMIKLKSQNEESADKVLETKVEKKINIKEAANQRLRDEIERAGKGNVEVKEELKEVDPSGETPSDSVDTGSLIDSYNITDNKAQATAEIAKEVVVDTAADSGDQPLAQNLKGKYTIQVGAYKTIEEAKSFAEGFEVRGYSPILNEVKIPGKGLWYRVSVGVFTSRSDAKDYIVKEKTLFQSYDYLIKKIN
jgi:cell division protein FtsN